MIRKTGVRALARQGRPLAGFDIEASAKDRALSQAERLSDAEISRSIDDLRLWAAEVVGGGKRARLQ
jgi:hypothetical protein